MSDTVIQVENLWKEYRLGVINHHTLTRDLQSWWARMRGKEDPNSPIGSGPFQPEDRFWALKDVSFEVKQGDILGIIGRNGAGKSTLLKILSQVTAPTKGEVRFKGRIASLLEVGTGFHPELTGRENIFLNGAILGMSKADIRKKLDEIVAFAEVDKFIDTPVKRYSSGMYVRLAFAVAAHLEPEILIVDEVLAVGDAAFQKKCLGKMENVGKEGRTVLFVSHNMGAVHSLTRKCVLLEKGEMLFYGDTHSTVERYLTSSLTASDEKTHDLNYYRPDYVIKANKDERKVRYNDIWIEHENKKTTMLDMGEPFNITFELEVYSEINGANLSLTFSDSEFHCVTVIFSWDNNFYINLRRGRHVIRLEIKDIILTPGKYYISTGINQSTESTAWDGIANLPLFEVRNSGKVVHWLHRNWGAVHFDNVQWSQNVEDR